MMNNEYLLQILIPTYNRESFLRHNIEILSSFIEQLELKSEVSIIVSDNKSTDGTVSILKSLQESLPIKLIVYCNDVNQGLEQNAVNILSYATAKYVMFLGDDDYISLEYLSTVYYKIQTDGTSCFIPSFFPVTMEGERLPGGRDIDLPSRDFPKGIDSSIEFFYRGHQLSGVTFLREGTLDAYLSECPRNIYLFMFFVGFNAKRGDSYHLTDFPVRVTQPPEGGKDWNYGEDGLAIDRFKNSYGLFHENKKIQYFAEKKLIMINNRSFLLRYAKRGIKSLWKYCSFILKSSYVTLRGKLFFLVFSVIQLSYALIKRLVRYKRVEK